jgi:hypothetical protein
MNDVLIEPDHFTARILGGARASDVLTVTATGKEKRCGMYKQ